MIPKFTHMVLSWGLTILCAVTFLGCRSAHPDPTDALVKRGDQLYAAYLEADQDQAKQDLVELIRLGETGKLAAIGQARWLSLDYARLFALQRRTGDQDMADVYFAKARYWDIRRRELSGESEADIVSSFKAFTPDSCIERVDKWDKDHSDGRGAKYIQNLRHQ